MLWSAFPAMRSVRVGIGSVDTLTKNVEAEGSVSLPLGVVLERRALDNPWHSHAWRPVAVIPGAAPLDPGGSWSLLRSGDGWDRFHAGTLKLELFPRETEGYRTNLSQEPPRLFVVLRSQDEADSPHDFVPFLVTACPYEAQDYLDSGDDIVEPVAMPDAVIAFVQDYVDRHHVDEPFHKRKRKRWSEQGGGIGRRSSRPQDLPEPSDD